MFHVAHFECVSNNLNILNSFNLYQGSMLSIFTRSVSAVGSILRITSRDSTSSRCMYGWASPWFLPKLNGL
jgi:hypothetical protein